MSRVPGHARSVTEPFSIEELMARVRAVTRRHRPETVDEEPVENGTHVVDLAARSVRAEDGELVHLTKTEWELLLMLVRHVGQPAPAAPGGVGPTYLTETHDLRQYLAQLRRKLEPDPARPRHLLTEPGMGYRFQP